MEGMTKKKGKEGTRGAKQIARENLDTIAFYRKMAVASTLVYLAGMVALGATFTYTELAMVAVCVIVFSASQYFMSFGTPRYSGPDSKELIDPGLDLNMEGGLAEHAKDAFILTSATLFLALISDYFFLLLLLAPLQAFWILWKNVIAPWIFAEAPEPDEADLKRQSKKERRQQKIKYR